jgi:hypothetical protein
MFTLEAVSSPRIAPKFKGGPTKKRSPPEADEHF